MRKYFVVLALAATAHAHQSPPGCNSNGVNFNMQRTPASVIVGGTVTYLVSASNLDKPELGLVTCDAEKIRVVFHCPGRDGTPTGLSHVLATSLSLPAGTTAFQVGEAVECTILVDPGITDAVAGLDAGSVEPTPLAKKQEHVTIEP